mgnify:CR=1 FL=1
MKTKTFDTFTGLLLVALLIYLSSLVTGCKTVVSNSRATIPRDGISPVVVESETKSKGFFVKSELVQPAGFSTNTFTLHKDGTFDYDNGKNFSADSSVADPDEAAIKAQGEAIGKANPNEKNHLNF